MPEKIPAWFFGLLVVAIALSWVRLLIGPDNGRHGERKAGPVVFGSVGCVLGLMCVTLWWRGELFNVVGWFTR